MPVYTDPYSSGLGGGTTPSVCSISPGDENAVLGNIISRLRDIETFLSRLVGADVYANNLAELAKDIGSILNGEILLPGTQNSPYGVGGSIPIPSDFTGTYISGNVTTIWNNGVVTYQVDRTGITVGGGLKYASYTNGGTLDTINDGNSDAVLNLDTEVADNSNLASISANTITINVAGDYLVFVNVEVTNAANFGNGGIRFLATCTGGSASLFHTVLTAADSAWDDGLQIGMDGFIQITAGNTLTVGIINDSGTQIVVWVKDVTLLKIS